jgi:glutamyl-tRNA(Gln) amidotransferase subunit E
MRNKEHYKKIGFMCGLEIHQRLATERKLFCACSASMHEHAPVGRIERRQRAVAGELGAVDVSTAFESARKRRFYYNIFRESSCLVDTDEEPPHGVNMEAMGIAMRIASSLDARIPYEIEPMRKEVVDGSDPSAFQRSMMVGYDGSIEVSGRRIPIPSIFLEEESSGIESSSKDEVIYNLDRLGIPLIEIDTDPVIETPEEAKEVARRIGLILRLSGKVQRGIGSIRQDVNVSIGKGSRVEIKGFQELGSMDEIIENEVERQEKLVAIREMLLRRHARVGTPIDVTGVFEGTGARIIKEKLAEGGIVVAVKLSGFGGLVGTEISKGLRLGTEISDYAKSAGVKGIIHSDENLSGSYGIASEEAEWIVRDLGVGPDDAFILIADEKERCYRAIALAVRRAELALEGVPQETRGIDQRLHVTRFLRPIPGGSRMYPETDAVPIGAAEAMEGVMMERIDPSKIMKNLEKELKNAQLSEQMLWSSSLQLYNQILARTGADPVVVAATLLEKFREMKRDGIQVERIGDDAIMKVFELYSSGRITKAAIETIMRRIPSDAYEVESAVRELSLERIGKAELKKIISEFRKAGVKDIKREVMTKYRLNVDGRELDDIIG